MSWENSDRKERLPDNWPALRRQVEARAGGRCEAIHRSGKRCHDKGNQCDHIVAGDDHSPANLQWLCEWHHNRKSSGEGNAAKAARKKKRFHPQPPHPGTMTPEEVAHAVSNQAGKREAQHVRSYFGQGQARGDAPRPDPER